MGQKKNKPKKCSVQYFLNCSYRLGRLKRQQTSDKLRFLHRSYMRGKQNDGLLIRDKQAWQLSTCLRKPLTAKRCIHRLTIEPWNHGTKNLKSLKNMVCCRLMHGSKYRLDPGLDFRFWKKITPELPSWNRILAQITPYTRRPSSFVFEAQNGPWTSQSYLKRYLASNCFMDLDVIRENRSPGEN